MRIAKPYAAWVCAGLLSAAAMAPTDALATFGGRSTGAFFSGQDLAAQGGQHDRVTEIKRSHAASIKPIEEQIDAIRGQITAQLVGADPIDQAQITTQEQRMFALRSRSDSFDLEEAIQIRAVLDASQLAQIALRHRTLDAAHSEESALENPSQFPASAYRSGDLFRDKLGFTRGLALTDTQLRQMARIENADTKPLRSIQQQRHAVKAQMSALILGSDPVTLAQLAPLQQRASALKEQIDTLRLTMAIQTRSILTAAQLTKAAELHRQLAVLDAAKSDLLTEAKSAD